MRLTLASAQAASKLSVIRRFEEKTSPPPSCWNWIPPARAARWMTLSTPRITSENAANVLEIDGHRLAGQVGQCGTRLL